MHLTSLSNSKNNCMWRLFCILCRNCCNFVISSLLSPLVWFTMMHLRENSSIHHINHRPSPEDVRCTLLALHPSFVFILSVFARLCRAAPRWCDSFVWIYSTRSSCVNFRPQLHVWSFVSVSKVITCWASPVSVNMNISFCFFMNHSEHRQENKESYRVLTKTLPWSTVCAFWQLDPLTCFCAWPENSITLDKALWIWAVIQPEFNPFELNYFNVPALGRWG